jgi:hypothetical protein
VATGNLKNSIIMDCYDNIFLKFAQIIVKKITLRWENTYPDYGNEDFRMASDFLGSGLKTKSRRKSFQLNKLLDFVIKK